jgi:molybdopterin molybdotransferase
MISYEAALSRILAVIRPLGLEKINFLDTLGRVIGEDIVASRPIPPKDNSAMDGYALRSADICGASRERPVVLDVIEDIPAGAIPQKRIGQGQAARIMTGAPVPEGADAVLRMEDTEKEGQAVRIFVEVPAGQDIRWAGEDVRPGETVITRGDMIRPAEIGMLAALGRSFISVHQKPRVAILATGDELVDVDETPSSWQIISSNSYATAAQVLDCGAIPLQIGIAKDTREDLAAKLQSALRADLIISSGGVSVGDYDLVKDVMREMGNHMQFWQVAMRPGKPLAFGDINGIPLFGLPGNPVSSMVSFEQFVRPSLLKMMGHRNLFRRTIQAVLTVSIEKKKGARHFIRARITFEDDRYLAVSTGEQGSGILKSMVKANGLIVLPEDTASVKVGEMVTVQLMDLSLLQTDQLSYL